MLIIKHIYYEIPAIFWFYRHFCARAQLFELVVQLDKNMKKDVVCF